MKTVDSFIIDIGTEVFMRRKEREVTDIEQILDIVARAKVLHLGLNDGDTPYVVPLHYAYEYADGTFTFYMHSAAEGHKLDLIRADGHACVTLECDTSLNSGGETACKWGAAYSSVMAKGTADLIDDPAEKARVLRLLMLNQTGREFTVTEEMTASVRVIRFTAASLTAKACPKKD